MRKKGLSIAIAVAQSLRGAAKSSEVTADANEGRTQRQVVAGLRFDWRQNAAQIARRVRAFDPFPGATARVAGETLKVWSAQALADDALALEAPGTVLRADAQGIVVQTGDGALCLNTLQRPGAKRLSVADFLRGFALLPGMAFELPDTNQSAD